jgi:hypothetical protein
MTTGPTQSLIQCVLGVLSPGVRQPEHEADHLIPRLRMRGLYLHSLNTSWRGA